MALDALSPPLEDGSFEDGRNQSVEDLRQKYQSLLSQSHVLSKEDKKRGLALLDDPEKGCDAGVLKMLVENFSEGENHIENFDRSYEKQIDEEIAAWRFSEKSKASYLKWFKDLSADKKAEYIKDKTTALHNPRRAPLAEIFLGKRVVDGIRIPEAIRKEHLEEFQNSDLEKREALVKKLLSAHKKLKEAFLSLPEETQNKYRAQFKSLGLKDREEFLSSLKTVEKGGENAERKHLREEFRIQMIEDGLKQNLFSSLSIPPYLMWLNGLSLEKQRRAVNEKQSDLYLRMSERIRVRDEFYALPEDVRRPKDLAFRNADLDRRKALLLSLKPSDKKSEGHTISYPDDVLRRTLVKTLQAPELQEQLLIHTLLTTEYALGRRAALRTDAVYQKDIAEKTKAKGHEVDDYQELFILDFQTHRENREGSRRRLLDQNKTLANQNAAETNTKFLNRERREVSAQEFKNTVVAGQRAELVARLVDLASQKLPNADPKTLQRFAEKMDLLIDLHKVAA